MTQTPEKINTDTALSLLDGAFEAGNLTAGARENITKWLTESRYTPYVEQVLQHLQQGSWQVLDDVFWTVIPFGTGGRRGRMYPVGTNAINDRTIGESAAGLAEYVQEQQDGGELACAIGYDTRHQSRHFAELSARIMVAAGFRVYFLDDYRSTPELSFLVRWKRCLCGIMVTASHNPPSDNAVKVYGSTGGQILPPHDRGVIDCVMAVDEIDEGGSFADGVREGRIVLCTEQTDEAFIREVSSQGFAGPRDVKILYSPLHGVGASAVVPVLEADGFSGLEVFALHAQPDGDFPNVPGHSANPENPRVFDSIVQRAREIGADVVLATDPDCDRIGCAAPTTLQRDATWQPFTGNQIGALLVDYVLEQRKPGLSPDHFVVTTLVTTGMIRRIADSYGVKTYGDLLVGFKWICGEMDRVGPERFVFGCEESHGYLVGTHVRDKDGSVAAMLMAELAAKVKAEGRSLHEKLDALFWQHGYHAEQLMTQQMEGSEGMQRMKELMARFRQDPPAHVAGLAVVAVRDYLHGQMIIPGGESEPLDGPTGDLVILDLAEKGNYVAARPSGTEPKVKFYMFTYVAPEQLADLERTREEMSQRLEQMQADMSAFTSG